MSFGQNLQYLRKMRNKMTQEELAERLNVSRQTISKWELNTAYPEMDKLIEICSLFSCSMDEVVRGDMNVYDESYSDIRVEEVDPFSYIRYAVVSREPEEDAICHIQRMAERLGITEPNIIGWDFPVLSQEQINVFNMHGYAAALILPENFRIECGEAEIVRQEKQKYIAITIRNYTNAPFRTIPNAYKVLMTHIDVNGIPHKDDKNIISCFEKEYVINGTPYMDVYIAIE